MSGSMMTLVCSVRCMGLGTLMTPDRPFGGQDQPPAFVEDDFAGVLGATESAGLVYAVCQRNRAGPSQPRGGELAGSDGTA